MGLREETGGKRENKAWEEEVAALAIPNRKPSCNLKISTLLIVQMGQSKEQKRKAADRV